MSTPVPHSGDQSPIEQVEGRAVPTGAADMTDMAVKPAEAFLQEVPRIDVSLSVLAVQAAMAEELAVGRRAIAANRELQEEITRLKGLLAGERQRANPRLRDEIARLKVLVAGERQRADNAETRAGMEEERAAKIRTALTGAATVHKRELDQLRRAHKKEVLNLRTDSRHRLATAHAEHADTVERMTREHAVQMERVSRQAVIGGLLARAADSGPVLGGLPGRLASTTDGPDPRIHVDAVAELVVAAVNGTRQNLDPAIAPLTEREIKVMRAAALGLEITEIAARVGVSRKMISNHFDAVYGKLGVRSRGAALAICLAAGWLDVMEIGLDLLQGVVEPLEDGRLDRQALRTHLMALGRRTDRDLLVLILMACGDDNPVIADKLELTVHVVSNCVSVLLGSIGARNRWQAVTILHLLAALTAADEPAADPAPAPDTTATVVAVVSPTNSMLPALSKRELERWGVHAQAMVPRGDADPAAVAIYNLLPPAPQMVLKGLTLSRTTGQIAGKLRVSQGVVQRHISFLCKRFSESSEVGLASLGQSLFREGDKETGGWGSACCGS